MPPARSMNSNFAITTNISAELCLCFVYKSACNPGYSGYTDIFNDLELAGEKVFMNTCKIVYHKKMIRIMMRIIKVTEIQC